MDTEFKINRSLLVVIICFCISVITFKIGYTQYYLQEYNDNKDFYRSYYFESALNEISTKSVYTVVGDSASENMLQNRDDAKHTIGSFDSAQVFVVNNNSKKTYSNHNIKSIDEFKKKTIGYPYVLEIDFKNNTLKRMEYGEEYNYTTRVYGKIAHTRKENVTTYIGIPNIYDIKANDYYKTGDVLNYSYKENERAVNEALVFIFFKVIALVVLLVSLFFYVTDLKDKNKSKEYESKLERKIKSIKLYKIEILMFILMSLTIILCILGYSVWYNATFSISIGFIIFYIERLIRNEGDIRDESFILKYIFKKRLIKNNSIESKAMFFIITFFITKDIIIIIASLIFYEFIYVLIIMFICDIVVGIFISKKINEISSISKALSELKKGNFNYKININKDYLFRELAEDINSLGDTINSSVEERLKSERMKTELITNVSHDLKTPLTAIINYVSLMKKEDIKPEHVKDYVTVLDNRTQKLKILIDDLFEAAKISSNDIEINLEKTDINQLLMQSIVELDDEIKKVNLDFITNVPQQEVYILGDGKKLWRVFENLILNVTKYSLKGTRVYIDMIEKDNKAVISIKNISKHPLNFDPNEITERFTRGDLSRNTEGSGLGLSIAKGFVDAQNGNLKIDILGDLFIVTLEFDLYDK